jgi:quercetin dioxygenase-like cupin family protein
MKIVSWNLLCLVLLLMHSNCVRAEDTESLPHAFEAGWQGNQTCQLLHETSKVRVGKCTFAPGVGHEKHYHNPHFGYVLEGGTMLIQGADGETEMVAKAGSSWETIERTVHQAMNVGSTTASYLIVEPRISDPAAPSSGGGASVSLTPD